METLEGSELGQSALQEDNKATVWYVCWLAVIELECRLGECVVVCIQPKVHKLGAEACMAAKWVQDSAGLCWQAMIKQVFAAISG